MSAPGSTLQNKIMNALSDGRLSLVEICHKTHTPRHAAAEALRALRIKNKIRKFRKIGQVNSSYEVRE